MGFLENVKKKKSEEFKEKGFIELREIWFCIVMG